MPVMKRTTIITTQLSKQHIAFGERIRLARLRRKFTAEIVAQRAGIGRRTYSKIEKGDPNVSLASYSMVLYVLGLSKDLDVLALDDELGRKLQDAGLERKKRVK